MTTKIKLKVMKGCGAPPEFRVKDKHSIPGRVKLGDIREVASQINAWITRNWMGWINWGWFLLCPCLVRFVKNDLLLREPLKDYIREASKGFPGGKWVYHRKVRTYGYGETSETVVKISILIVSDGDTIEEIASQKLTRKMKKMGKSTPSTASSSSEASAFQRRITVSDNADKEAVKLVSMDYVGEDESGTDNVLSQRAYDTADEGERSQMTEDDESSPRSTRRE